MSEPISVLILEDNLADFEIVAEELRRSGIVARCDRAETEGEFLAKLEKNPDVILADFSLPGFSVLKALEILKMRQSVSPIIMLAGAVNQETVVECMKRGASDCLLKDRLPQLGPAVIRGLKEREQRVARRQEEQTLRRKNAELEELYRMALSASRRKSMFLANMSHELRTPLTTVVGFTELLVDGKVGDVSLQQLDLLQDVLGNARHLLHVINDVLDLARVESGSMQFSSERTCISETVGETITGLRMLGMEKGITLRSEIQLPFSEVLVDPRRLKQVLLNYISNSLKFTPPGGTITIRVTPEGASSVRIEVHDTGIGIRPEDIGRLFQDFNQLEDGSGKQSQGTGLGLSLTKRLVEAQGGKVGVSSTFGQGTTFFAILPFRMDESSIESRAADSVAGESKLDGREASRNGAPSFAETRQIANAS